MLRQTCSLVVMNQRMRLSIVTMCIRSCVDNSRNCADSIYLRTEHHKMQSANSILFDTKLSRIVLLYFAMNAIHVCCKQIQLFRRRNSCHRHRVKLVYHLSDIRMSRVIGTKRTICFKSLIFNLEKYFNFFVPKVSEFILAHDFSYANSFVA